MDREKQTKVKQVTAQLLTYIREQGLHPGDKLPGEEELAELFRVSRVSIRSATDGLKFFGVLNSAPGRGTVIADIDFAGFANHIGFQFAFTFMPLEQLMTARIVIECGLMELISRNLTEADYLALCEKAEKCRRLSNSADDAAKQVAADFEFHCALIRISGNQVMIALMQLLETIFFYSAKSPAPMEDTRITRDEHLAIVNALHNRNVELARGIMLVHLARSRRGDDDENEMDRKL